VLRQRFINSDSSTRKNMNITTIIPEFRAKFFDLFNQAKCGQPCSVVRGPIFGRITNTRFLTGECGSLLQVQFKFSFQGK